MTVKSLVNNHRADAPDVWRYELACAKAKHVVGGANAITRAKAVGVIMESLPENLPGGLSLFFPVAWEPRFRWSGPVALQSLFDESANIR